VLHRTLNSSGLRVVLPRLLNLRLLWVLTLPTPAREYEKKSSNTKSIRQEGEACQQSREQVIITLCKMRLSEEGFMGGSATLHPWNDCLYGAEIFPNIENHLLKQLAFYSCKLCNTTRGVVRLEGQKIFKRRQSRLLRSLRTESFKKALEGFLKCGVLLRDRTPLVRQSTFCHD
jgi:hypothetical protein